MFADEKMTDEFYDWPVIWVRGTVKQDSIDYTFVCPDNEENDNE
jgi:hypothetical protein